MSVELLRKKLTVQDYRQMTESGIINEKDRVELIRGEIVEMSPIGTRHAAYVRRLNTLFSGRLLGRAIVDILASGRIRRYLGTSARCRLAATPCRFLQIGTSAATGYPFDYRSSRYHRQIRSRGENTSLRGRWNC